MQPPSRRTFLALGLILTAAACTTTPDQGKPADARRPDPDEPLRRRAVAATDTLLAAYDALPATQLQPLRAEVAQHRAALAQTLTPSTPPTPSTTTPATAAAPPTTAELATLERQTAQTHLADLGTASPQLARLLASVAASAAVHATALGDTTAPAGSPSATPSAALTPEAVTALQGALNAEHAAVYGYGVVGAKLPEDQQRADARTAYAAHQARRDAWQRLLTGAGATPGAAAAGYQLPFPVTDAPSATRLAAHIETRLTTIYADLVAAVPSQHRTTAADALRETALRARHWGAPQTPFPGINDQPLTPTPSTTPPTP